MTLSNDQLPKILVEACCDSTHSARVAQAFGADRIELCGPGEGGTTPSLGLMARCRDQVTVPLHVMIRPHAGGFFYSEEEVDIMCNDILTARSLGVDGVVVGPLHSDATIHALHLAELISAARPLNVVFHRAFDQTRDVMTSLDTLISLGVHAILTSGQARTALDGADTLAALHARAADRLSIMAGGNVRGHSVRDIVARSGVRAVHARATDPMIVRGVVQALAQPSHRPVAAMPE